MNKFNEDFIIDVDSKTLIKGTFYDSPSKKGVLLVPGFTEHRSSLNDLALKLSPDFKVWVFDINSQGESTGKFNLNEIGKSTNAVGNYIKSKFDIKNLGACGNSIGGMAVGINAANSDIFDVIGLISTPAGIQDVFPKYLSTFLKYVPQQLVRQGTIIFDRLESRKNENYLHKSHKQFFDGEKYEEYAQLGALKINNIYDIVKDIKNSPRLDAVSDKISVPSLFLYGGNDSLLGIKHGLIPEKIYKMFASVNSKEKNLFIWQGADHSLNEKTKIDDCFNQDDDKITAKEDICNHFLKYL